MMENKKITMAAADAEKLEMLVSYYDAHTVEKIHEKHPGFVEDDLTTILEILKKALEV